MKGPRHSAGIRARGTPPSPAHNTKATPTIPTHSQSWRGKTHKAPPLTLPSTLIGCLLRRPAHGRGAGVAAGSRLRSAPLRSAARPPWPGAARSPSASLKARTCPLRTCECRRGGLVRSMPWREPSCRGVSPQQVLVRWGRPQGCPLAVRVLWGLSSGWLCDAPCIGVSPPWWLCGVPPALVASSERLGVPRAVIVLWGFPLGWLWGVHTAMGILLRVALGLHCIGGSR